MTFTKKQLLLFNLVMLLKQFGEVHLPLQSLVNECQFYHLFEPWGCSTFSMFPCRRGKTWWKKLVGSSSNRESLSTNHLEKQNRRVWEVSQKAEPLWLLRDRAFMLKEGRSVNETWNTRKLVLLYNLPNTWPDNAGYRYGELCFSNISNCRSSY